MRATYAVLPMLLLACLAAVPASAQATEIYWCPMRGAPCQLDDYHGPGKCTDCKMPLVTKTRYLEFNKQVEANKMTLGVVLYEGFELLDVFGPLEMFAYAPEIDIVMIAEEAGAIKSGQGPSANADYGFEDAPKLDLLLVPGGAGTFREMNNETMLSWLRERSATAEITTSVCSGSAILAKAGILDGRRATSNKQFFDLAASEGKEVEWVWDARWVDDGDIVTSSGVSAGMDMALHVIKRLFGEEAAESIAIGTEYEWQRDSTHDPFSKLIERK